MDIALGIACILMGLSEARSLRANWIGSNPGPTDHPFRPERWWPLGPRSWRVFPRTAMLGAPVLISIGLILLIGVLAPDSWVMVAVAGAGGLSMLLFLSVALTGFPKVVVPAHVRALPGLLAELVGEQPVGTRLEWDIRLEFRRRGRLADAGHQDSRAVLEAAAVEVVRELKEHESDGRFLAVLESDLEEPHGISEQAGAILHRVDTYLRSIGVTRARRILQTLGQEQPLLAEALSSAWADSKS